MNVTCDKTGVSDCSVAINAAIQAANPGDVIYLPTGKYRLDQPVYLSKDDITLRGQDTNTILFSDKTIYMVVMGGNAALSPTPANITSGYEKGSTTLTLDSTAGMTVGDIIRVIPLIRRPMK